MEKSSYKHARELLFASVSAVDTQRVALSCADGRILANDLIASENVPAFDRSPYDGYALRADDTFSASENHPVSLRITEEISPEFVPSKTVVPGTATKILTGAMIPDGADAVVMHEKTEFDRDMVTLFAPVKEGENIVFKGEDVCEGTVLAKCGVPIDFGLAGMLAAMNETDPIVFCKPKIALISTGNELVEADVIPKSGHIRNTNRYVLEAVLTRLGCEPVYYGIAKDSVEEISALIEESVSQCDAVIITGGVSAGDYDLTPAAMEAIGAEMLFRGLAIKPGMACAYGIKDGKLICGLSGNPASALTNIYAVALPALKKLTGRKECFPKEFDVTLSDDFMKASPVMRFLRGELEIINGVACIRLSQNQGNVILSSMIGCDMMAVVPKGSGPLKSGTVLKGFLL